MNLLTEVPIISNEEELEQYLKPLYIIEDYMRSFDDYVVFQEKMYNIIKGCFEHKECREHKIKFKFYVKDSVTYTLELRHFIINIFAWYPFVELYGIRVLNETFILDCYNDITANGLERYINEKLIKTARDYNVKNVNMNTNLSKTLYNLRRISLDFSLIMGLSISTEIFIDLYQKNQRFAEIMQTKFDESMQPNEIEKALNSLMNEEISLLKAEKGNPLGIILTAGSGIKHKQLSEFTINGGLKPDLNGVTIPLPINSNTMIGGLNTVSSLYIDASGARKSLIMNKRVMGKAGWFGKIVLYLARTLQLSKTVSDCGTRHLITMPVKSKKVLEKLHGRYYRLTEDENETLKLLDSRKDSCLIGTTIYLRSPVTCACGDEICPKCYGISANINFDIAEGISAYSSEEITKVVNQSILSTKHLLTTKSEAIRFNDEFYKFFDITADEITPKINTSDIENIEDYAIIIKPEDTKKVDEMDDDALYNVIIENGIFYVKNMVTKEEIKMQAENNKELFLTEIAIELGKNKGMIKFKNLSDDDALFVMDIMNDELTKPLYEIMDLVNKTKKGKNEIQETLDSISEKFLDLLIQSGIQASSVQAELIINRLVRDVNNRYHRPDFTSKELPDFDIYTVTKALEYNKSPLLGIGFQNIKRQLLSDATFYEKDEESYIDPFFKKKLQTKPLLDRYRLRK